MKLQKLLLPVCLISVLSGFIASDLQSGKKHEESDRRENRTVNFLIITPCLQ